jgi:hypothetical protein
MRYREAGRSWWPVVVLTIAAVMVVAVVYLLYFAP